VGLTTTRRTKNKLVRKRFNVSGTCPHSLGRRNMDMRFGLWNITNFYRAGSLMTVSRELSKYKSDLVGVQEVRWEGSDTETVGV
jgi:hypothetical protein